MTRSLHLVRAAAGEPARVADHDWIVYLEHQELAPHGAPPVAPGPIDHDQLVVLVFAADRVVTW